MKAITVRKPSIALIILVVLVALLAIPSTAVQAAHSVTVTLDPAASKTSASKVYTLTVTNDTTSTDIIGEVKLDVPPVGTGGSNFDVTVINNPTGWTSSFTTDQFGTRVDTITWTATAGNEIGVNEQQAFTFTATSPGTEAVGLVWTITTEDTVGATVTTTVTTDVENGPPKLLSVGWSDEDADPNITANDLLVFTFDEPMDESTITVATLDDDLPPSAGTYGTSPDPTLAWDSKSPLTRPNFLENCSSITNFARSLLA
ncbi:MAG: hypothetical protein IID01_13280, partial [Chloroflexi bacterium]|nr:hypothetical protein [Chloroflexota bacterium]